MSSWGKWVRHFNVGNNLLSLNLLLKLYSGPVLFCISGKTEMKKVWFFTGKSLMSHQWTMFLLSWKAIYVTKFSTVTKIFHWYVCHSFVLDHQCDTNGCKRNLVLDGNFDNNRECCMAKDSGFIQYDSLPGQIRSGCIVTPKLGSRFCENHIVDHKELDKEKNVWFEWG